MSHNTEKLIRIENISVIVHLPVPDGSVAPHHVPLAPHQDIEVGLTALLEPLHILLSLALGVRGEDDGGQVGVEEGLVPSRCCF